MKFLCVQCDEPMKLKQVLKQESEGTLSVVYECPSCLQEFAMLTNPHETQLVSALGVKIGPGGGGSHDTASQAEPKCPFTGMLQAMSGDVQSERQLLLWEEDALARLAKIPEFIRPMARKGVEEFARERGYATVNIRVLEEARQSFGF